MGHKETYKQWKEMADDAEVAAELLNIEDNETEIKSRFSTELRFGTAGLRSKLGAGTNRMNVYTVGRATQGLSEYVKGKGGQTAGMVIAYDTRKNSKLFAQTAALCFAANGIKAYLFDKATSVPELSFAIRHLQAFGGVVITASHNPKDYNGYKAYASWGGQLLSEASAQVTKLIEAVGGFDRVLSMNKDEAIQKGLLVMLGDSIDNAYYQRLIEMAKRPENVQRYAGDIHFVYTPLFGTGMRTFSGVLKNMPYRYTLVEDQISPDPEFPGLIAPNPEDERAMKKAIALAQAVGADIAFGTDPDADRLGAAIPNENGAFIMLSGNQVGCIIVDYLLRQRKDSGLLKTSDYIVKSFVSTRMADEIAQRYGIECLTVPTGFKYIADAMNRLENRQFVFGFEESCGFLADGFLADKDGIMAGLLLLEVLCECKKNGETLYQRLRALYQKYGWHKEKVLDAMLDCTGGMDKVKTIMQSLRNSPPSVLGRQNVSCFTDYLSGVVKDSSGIRHIDFPSENALSFTLDKGWFCIRPSGTEPKLRVYFGAREQSNEACDQLMKELERDARAMIDINR
ncbi:MAG: phospho-sugar mutase [Christensenellales bacterium]